MDRCISWAPVESTPERRVQERCRNEARHAHQEMPHFCCEHWNRLHPWAPCDHDPADAADVPDSPASVAPSDPA